MSGAASGGWHLAEINVAIARAPLDDPIMAGFVRQLDAINRLAEEAPGFVWRLMAPGGGPSSYLRVSADPRVIVNLSVWTAIEPLFTYVYRTDHAAIYRARASWFEEAQDPAFALWWIPAGHLPTVEEGLRCLGQLRAEGSTPAAFTFRRRYPPPDSARV
jgi:hypothetical protein